MTVKSLAIITGASKGIGLSTAARYRAAGWDVLNLSRTPCDLKGVVNHLCDFADLKALHAVLETIELKLYDRVSIVHNAAVTRKDTYATATEEDFIEVMKINVLVPQIINRKLIPALPAGSSIIFIGSTLSERGVPNSHSYTVSKHALAGLMKATCQDLAGTGIHGCLICPGFTDTAMLKDVIGPDEATWEMIKGCVLMGRLADPAEIAELAYFCSTNPVINGSVLHANLGQR
jgi:3-oxoacyl-[acyl-carrier protein] reductase